MRRPFLPAMLGIAGVFAVILFFFFSSSGDEVVCRVGDYAITRRDAERKEKIVRVYYPEETRSVGVALLSRAYQAASLWPKLGAALTHDKVLEEASRIERDSKDRQRLGRIRAVFSSDEAGYLRVFVLPTLAERGLPELYAKTGKKDYSEWFARASREIPVSGDCAVTK